MGGMSGCGKTGGGEKVGWKRDAGEEGCKGEDNSLWKYRLRHDLAETGSSVCRKPVYKWIPF